MPEFRFRRKKQQQQQQNRRTTLNNPEETARQLQEAKKLVKPILEPSHELVNDAAEEPVDGGVGVAWREGGAGLEVGPMEKRNSFVQEREKFLELLKTKYPEQAISLDVGVAKGEESGNGQTASSADRPSVMVCFQSQ